MTSLYMPTNEEVVEFYNNAIPLIDRLVGTNVHLGYWESPEDPSTVAEATDRLTDFMIERLAVDSSSRVLDLGCGLGAPAIRLAKTTGATVVGVATSANLLERARRSAVEAGVADLVDFQLADAVELPFGDSSFDAVLAIESIVHMPDLPGVFGEVGRVLSDGGHMVATDFFLKGPLVGRRLEIVEAYRRLSLNTPLLQPEDYPPLLRAAGMHLLEYRDITQQTMRHHREMIRAAQRQRAELVHTYGPEMIDTFISVFEQCLDISEPGYLLFTAERTNRSEHQPT
ncbi:SAM-dependent methyltransferase [Nocardia panacis]|uniref:SAM-dependent methyltransferase n=1 Tax=Nocardia panacis TaxID=2340916 RepID=UPI0013151DBD|nr:methyltransferase domain-containing protein [Nocardia panacis]